MITNSKLSSIIQHSQMLMQPNDLLHSVIITDDLFQILRNNSAIERD